MKKLFLIVLCIMGSMLNASAEPCKGTGNPSCFTCVGENVQPGRCVDGQCVPIRTLIEKCQFPKVCMAAPDGYNARCEMVIP